MQTCTLGTQKRIYSGSIIELEELERHGRSSFSIMSLVYAVHEGPRGSLNAKIPLYTWSIYFHVVAGWLVLVSPYLDLDANLIVCAPTSNTANTFFIHTSPRIVRPPLFGWTPLKHSSALVGTVISNPLTKKVFFPTLTPNTGGLAVQDTK